MTTKKIFVLALFACGACESSRHLVATDRFGATLGGDRVRPTAVTTTASGSVVITLTSKTSLLEYQLTFAGLSSAATSAHIHGPAADTAVANALVDFAALPQGSQGTIQLGTSGSASGTIDLSKAITAGVSGDSLFNLLHAGLLYADVHTAGHTGGEIRGRITRK